MGMQVGKDPTKLTELVGPCDVEVHVLPDGMRLHQYECGSRHFAWSVLL